MLPTKCFFYVSPLFSLQIIQKFFRQSVQQCPQNCLITAPLYVTSRGVNSYTRHCLMHFSIFPVPFVAVTISDSFHYNHGISSAISIYPVMFINMNMCCRNRTEYSSIRLPLGITINRNVVRNNPRLFIRLNLSAKLQDSQNIPLLVEAPKSKTV